jgi:acyl-CoA dehydrogenase
MNFDFSDDQKQLREEARKFLEKNSPPTASRAILEGTEPYDKALWKGLCEMGFLGAAIPEEFGGLGAGYLELCVIAEELGRALAPVPVSSSIYLAAEFLLQAGSAEQKAKWLPKLAQGEVIGTFAYAETIGRVTPASIKTAVSGGKISGTKVPVPDGEVANLIVVAARDAGTNNLSLYLVDGSDAGVKAERVDSVDPARPQARLTFDGAAAELLGTAGAGNDIISTVLDRAAILTAFEQVGGSDKALEMGRDYALDRMAFGRPIGSFQAVKHMLADMYVAATLARSNAYYGAWALSTDAAELPIAAATARVSATQSYIHCAKNNIQVHGGMGFTWAFDCHQYYRRANNLALGLGSLTTWESLLIDRMSVRNDAPAAA